MAVTTILAENSIVREYSIMHDTQAVENHKKRVGIGDGVHVGYKKKDKYGYRMYYIYIIHNDF